MTEEPEHIEEEVKPQNKFQRIVEAVLHVLGIEEFITYAQVMHNFLFVAAIVFIGILEIFNTHLAVRLSREIDKKQEIIRELRWEYTSIKTDMNQKSKQSALQTILEPYGLKTLQEPPKKIEVKKDAIEK